MRRNPHSDASGSEPRKIPIQRILVGLALAVCGSGAVSGAARAEGGVAVEPGKWRTVTTTTMPMAPQPIVRESTECITRAEFRLDQLMDPSSPCRIEMLESSSREARWKLHCDDAKGEGHFRSDGASARGEMELVMQARGQTMVMETRWEARRLGACD